MTTEHQQEMASLYALGSLAPDERCAFKTQMDGNPELLAMVLEIQKIASLLAVATPTVVPRAGLKQSIFQQIEKQESLEKPANPAPLPNLGLSFAHAAAKSGWKPLPVKGTYIKLLSFEKERGYAVLLGKLDPGARYPEHQNAGPEDFYILNGDLVVGDRKLDAGDFHHADAGSQHPENYSINGCTLIAVLTASDPLVAFALG